MKWPDGLVVTLLGWYRKRTSPLDGSLFQLTAAETQDDNHVGLRLPNTGLTWNGTAQEFLENFEAVEEN